MSSFTIPGVGSVTLPSVEDWTKSDTYFKEHLIEEDPVLDASVKHSQASGLPEIAVSAGQGKFLKLIAQSINAKRILEVGTLGGYSTTWLARALPEDGKLITLELSEKHAKVARENIDRAGQLSKVEVKVGPASDTLKQLNAAEPFDFVFIDADWDNVWAYFAEAKRLTRKGGVILVDNVNFLGKVALEPEDSEEYGVHGFRKLFKQIKGDKEVDATALTLAGERIYDAMLYAVKL